MIEPIKIKQGKVFVYNKLSGTFEETKNAEFILSVIFETAENSKGESQKKETDLMKNNFVLFLQKNNFNPTVERLAILEKIQNEAFEFTIKKIHEKVLKELHISLRTVNNTFHLLLDAGIIKTSNKKSRTSYFELAS